MELSQIENLSRKELQSLAKEKGIKANAKTKVLVEKLVMWFEQNKENEVETKKKKTPKKTPKKKTKTPKKTKDLNSMTRKELQNLCKDNGIRANQKTSKLLEILKNVYEANTEEKEEKSTVKKKTIDVVEDEKTIDDEIIVQKDEEKIVKEKKRHSTLKSFDTSPVIQYGNRRRKSLKAKQLVSFNEIFDDAMNEEKSTESAKENKKRRKIYVKALKCKPFKAKKSKRPTTAPKAFNLSTSNYGSHKKRNRNGEPLKPTWKMKTKPLPPFRGESLFSPKKPRKRTKNAFNLQESLAMPLTWVPKKGKIPSF